MKKISAAALISSIFAVFLAGLPLWAAAATTYYVNDTLLPLSGGQTLTIAAGSAQDGLTMTADSVTVTVPADEAFILRSPGPRPAVLENDALLPHCNVLTTEDNQMLIRGPLTATVTPSALTCSTANASKNTTPMLAISQPNGGETLKSGTQYQIFWQVTAGTDITSVRLRLSTDGGLTFPTAVTDGLINNGFFNWTVPSMPTTAKARLKLDAIGGTGGIQALAVSQADFTIQGDQPAPVVPPVTPTPPTVTYSFDPAAVTAAATSIDVDRSFSLPPYSPTPVCVDGTRIKGQSSSAVYYCGADGRRHAFPNQKIYDSWYSDFAGVAVMSDATLASISLGVDVTYRPGVRLLKIQTDPKVYAVGPNGTLRWVKTEAVAAALYGADWNRKVDDVPDAFFADYRIGDPIE